MGPHVLRTSLGLAALPLALWACGADEESDAAQACPDNASVPLGPDRDGDCVSDADDLFPDDPDDRLVRIEAGEFVMGSAMDWGDLGGGGPQHWVQITRPFLMGPTEVTQALWLSVMGDNPSTFGQCGETCPVEQVSWFEVAAFCNALSRLEGRDECYVFTPRGSITGDDVTWPRGLDCTGYRLPTEAEWEYAGRAGTQSAWFCGEDEDCLRGVAWYKRNSKPTTHPVGEKAANAWGLHDMAGNVLEWVWDWWPGDYAQDRVDPTGPSAGAYRMIRNGSWGSPSLQLRADYRNSIHPTVSLDSLGFRLARSLP